MEIIGWITVVVLGVLTVMFLLFQYFVWSIRKEVIARHRMTPLEQLVLRCAEREYRILSGGLRIPPGQMDKIARIIKSLPIEVLGIIADGRTTYLDATEQIISDIDLTLHESLEEDSKDTLPVSPESLSSLPPTSDLIDEESDPLVMDLVKTNLLEGRGTACLPKLPRSCVRQNRRARFYQRVRSFFILAPMLLGFAVGGAVQGVLASFILGGAFAVIGVLVSMPIIWLIDNYGPVDTNTYCKRCDGVIVEGHQRYIYDSDQVVCATCAEYLRSIDSENLLEISD